MLEQCIHSSNVNSGEFDTSWHSLLAFNDSIASLQGFDCFYKFGVGKTKTNLSSPGLDLLYMSLFCSFSLLNGLFTLYLFFHCLNALLNGENVGLGEVDMNL